MRLASNKLVRLAATPVRKVRPVQTVGNGAKLHNARIPPIIRQSKLLPTAALAEPTAGKLSLTARPAANNAANARLWLVRTAPRSANPPVPDLPSPQKKTAITTATLRV